MHFHQKEWAEVVQDLNTSAEGLSAAEAQKRLTQYGPNELEEKKKKTLFGIFLAQFKDFMILVLMAAAVISGFIGEPSDTIAILVIVILNAVIGFVQEYRAEKAMAALKQMAAPFALVLRDKQPIQIHASELVPGDMVLLEAGRVVPADLRLMEAAQLQVEEAALTGESVPVEKQVQSIPDPSLPLGDRRNLAFKGTFVTYGRGAGVVTATGMKTELGRIATMLQEGEEVKTPLQKRLTAFGQRLALVVLAICFIIFVAGLFRNEPLLLMLLTAISLAVAAIPEALPAVVTITLALGARKLVRQNALIRKLPAVETLGSVTYICSDKTGTLTLNKMTVEEIFLNGKVVRSSEISASSIELFGDQGSEIRVQSSENEDQKIGNFMGESGKGGNELRPLPTFLTALALNNDAQVDQEGKLIGDPTELALFDLARQKGFEKQTLEKVLPRRDEIPFDADRKCMTTVHRFNRANSQGPKFVSFTKGAVDVLLEKSEHLLTSQGPVIIERDPVDRITEKMAEEGLRVLGVAMRLWETLPENLSPETMEKGLIFIGLAGLMDPPREEAREAIRLCRTAGIIPVMITGDHPVTAATIAKRLGLVEDDSQAVMTGRELEKMPLPEFEKKVEHIRVYARVAPEQKLKIVQALQDKGQFVAMTGDGVNDAPALKRADIGIAMGITGTDVSKEAAHLILLDDNFATIVKAVKEGRKIFDNIRKFIKYLLTTNSGEIWTLFLAPLVGLPIPLLPIHILWVNLVTDGLPALALSVEPEGGDVMKRPPRHPKESIFSRGLGLHAIWVGLLMGLITLSVQTWTLHTGNGHWQTMVFTVLCLTQLGHVLAIRSEKESLFTQGLFTNIPLLGAVGLTFALQMATIYVPFLNPIFKTVPLTFRELVITLALSTVVFWAVEVEKYFKRRSDVF
ncbi:MAG: cation-translocating P-type ATPase [Thermodesulfobacteriota bacterium]